MAETTEISWADATFNPWIGCTAVSPGCDHCYAEALATNRLGVAWGAHAERKRTSERNWAQVKRWDRAAATSGKRKRVFCASLADVFDNQVDPAWRTDLWQLIAETPNLVWMLLTKRPQNIEGMLPTVAQGLPAWGEAGWENVWLGTTCENQAEADRRIPHLRRVPARLRFLSCEPLLGPLDIRRHLSPDEVAGMVGNCAGIVPAIDWVIAGGEAGTHARPVHPDWIRSLRDQCALEDVPFHFKQWGEWSVYYDRDRDDPDWRRCPSPAAPRERYLNLAGGHGFHGDRVVAVRRSGKRFTGHELDGAVHMAIPDA